MDPYCVIKKNKYIKLIWRNLKVKIVDLTVEPYFKGRNYNFNFFFPILPELNDFYIKQNVSIRFSSIYG